MPSSSSLKDTANEVFSEIIRRSGCTRCCSRKVSPEEAELRRRSKRIDKEIKNDQRRMQRQVKLLLLGAGESGKSTFLKQMKIIHGVQFEPEQIKEFQQIIYQNIIRGMKVLVDATRKLDIDLEHEQNYELGDRMLGFGNLHLVNETNFAALKPVLSSLWNDQGIQEAFNRRNEFQIADSIEYFYKNLDRVSDPKYVPTQQDILFCRKTTKGIIEFPLLIENVPFLFVDVGGQRTQRQKWFQCFDCVTSILFIASSSEFDQVLLEDRNVNRLEESRNIFDTIINHRIFSTIPFILFLNKMDLLEDKVVGRKLDISNYFPEEFSDVNQVRSFVDKFEGNSSDLADVKRFILYLFASKQKNHSKPLYHHFTTAVDTRNIQYVFNSVKETILRKNLDALMLQ